MIRLIPALLLLLAIVASVQPSQAQWTVSTLVAGPAGLDDGISIDSVGNLYVSHYDGTTIKKVTPEGVVSTFVSGLLSPNATTIASDGTFYIPNATGSRITRVSPDGTVDHTFATGIQNPAGVALNATGDTLYVSQYQLSRITRFPLADPSQKEVYVSGSPLNGPVGMALGPDGSLLVGNFDDGRIVRVAPDRSMSTLASIPQWMGAMTVSGSDIYATSFSTNRIYRIGMDGSTELIAGDRQAGSTDGPGLEARFSGPNGIAATVTGDTLYVTDYSTESVRMLVRSTSTATESSPDLGALPVYPNPFRNTLTIPSSPRDETQIFDVRGRLVATLPPSSVPAEWDAIQAGPGLYIVRQGTRTTPVMKTR